MRNFQKLAENIDTMPLLSALAVNGNLWNQHDLRTRYPQSPHHLADDILLMFNEIPDDITQIIDDTHVKPYPAWYQLPAKDMVFNLMRAVGGMSLGRVMITRLAPGDCIATHIDEGAPAEYYNRYQIMLQCLPGVNFRAGDEAVMMKTGDAYWFDNRIEHSVENYSADDRIALIVDIRTC